MYKTKASYLASAANLLNKSNQSTPRNRSQLGVPNEIHMFNGCALSELCSEFAEGIIG